MYKYHLVRINLHDKYNIRTICDCNTWIINVYNKERENGKTQTWSILRLFYNIIGLSILYYCKKILAYWLTNLNTQLGMLNEARILVAGVITDLQDNIQLSNLSHFAYNPNFLNIARQ